MLYLRSLHLGPESNDRLIQGLTEPCWFASLLRFAGRSGGLAVRIGRHEPTVAGFSSPVPLGRPHSGSFDLHSQVEEAFEVVTGGHQGPFKAGLFLAAKQEAPEADGFPSTWISLYWLIEPMSLSSSFMLYFLLFGSTGEPECSPSVFLG
jgi:hypothetical protein